MKIFCVGLHKAGTSSLHELFQQMGYRSMHGTSWSQPPVPNRETERFDSFSDGGGHVWDDGCEFGGNHRLRLLRETYPQSKFILQYRDLRPWLISKMLHAGWRVETEIVPGSDAFHHDMWREKSLEVIHAWIDNRVRYHRAAAGYLATFPEDALVIDVIAEDDQTPRIADFLLGAGRYRVRPRVTGPHRLFNRLSRTFVPATMPRANVRKTNAENKARCAEIVDGTADYPSDADPGVADLRGIVEAGRAG